jgi:hypothetical protein
VLVVVQFGVFSHIKGKHTIGKTFGPESEQGAGEWSMSVKEDEMGWACSMCAGFLWGIQKEREQLEDRYIMAGEY